MQLHEKILAMREGGWTDRMHTVLKLRKYEVAGHQWNVTMLMMQLFPEDVLPNLTWACMTHDIPERWVGDTPYPAKRKLSPVLGAALEEAEQDVADYLGITVELTEREQQILNICDMLELVLWAKEEVAMGNSLMEGTRRTGQEALMWMPLYDEISGTCQRLFTDSGASENKPWWKKMMGFE